MLRRSQLITRRDPPFSETGFRGRDSSNLLLNSDHAATATDFLNSSTYFYGAVSMKSYELPPAKVLSGVGAVRASAVGSVVWGKCSSAKEAGHRAGDEVTGE
jgi:hypothetical protein